ncbi:unnamed protein product [Tetraodon nigroviridis]|uniref:(spotted green pufferfish) hypothetical protein n=1 Tax=Tetraodon nigroviridis TaxID=99883 RepID=Q4TIM7_TETNG|nr:unnamed protein product [Tetraodon nigroviridis]
MTIQNWPSVVAVGSPDQGKCRVACYPLGE